MRWIFRLIWMGVLASIALGGWLAHVSGQAIHLEQPVQDLTLKHGTSLRGVAQQLVREGVLVEPWSFILLVRLQGKAGEIQAGNYQLTQGMTVSDLFQMMSRGNTVQRSITFIEGWSFRQMRAALNDHPDIRHLSMHLTDAEILAQIGAEEPHPEGLFFPDSYYFGSGMSDLEILQRAYHTMRKKLDIAWRTRESGLPYQSPYEALIMASIVEKETGRGDERPLIARVFLNRMAGSGASCAGWPGWG